jgi:sugar phosphate isomerase/epimerase
MLKFAVNEVTTYRWTLDEDAARYAAAGFHGIGVWRRKLSDFGEERGRELLAESGLGVSSLGWCGGFTGADGRTLKESLADAQAAVATAAELDADNLVLYSGGRGGHTHNHARRLLVSALKDLAPFAEECGVRLAIEPMHPACGADWTFLTTLEETLQVIALAGSPAVGVVVDLYHLGHHPGFLESVRANLHAVALVQLGDAAAEPTDEQELQSRRVKGTGTIFGQRLAHCAQCKGRILSRPPTLQLPWTVEVAGKRFDQQPQFVKQGWYGQIGEQKVTVKETRPENVRLDGDQLECELRRAVIEEEIGSRVTELTLSAGRSPYLISRRTTSVAEDGSPRYSTEVETMALDMPYQVLTELKTGAFVKTTHRDRQGVSYTFEVFCGDVPGGVVAHSAKETDLSGKVIRRTALELVDYGLPPATDP